MSNPKLNPPLILTGMSNKASSSGGFSLGFRFPVNSRRQTTCACKVLTQGSFAEIELRVEETDLQLCVCEASMPPSVGGSEGSLSHKS
jgi:hypothetical protein